MDSSSRPFRWILRSPFAHHGVPLEETPCGAVRGAEGPIPPLPDWPGVQACFLELLADLQQKVGEEAASGSTLFASWL